MPGSKKVITGSHPHPLLCDDCTGLPELRSVLIYDSHICDSGYRTELAFFAEPCSPFVYAVALCHDESVIESALSLNGTIYAINVGNDTAPFIRQQETFNGNSLKDMFLLFTPANNSAGVSGGYLTMPVSLFGVDPSPPLSTGSTLRSAFTNARVGHVAQTSGAGVEGRYFQDVTLGWVDGYNVGGNTVATARLVVATDYTTVSGDFGFLLFASTATIPPDGFVLYHSDNPYAMFDVDGGYFWGLDTTGQLDIVDITDPTAPTLVSSTTGICGTAACVQRRGNTLWIGDSATDDLIGVDVSDPSTPTVISTTALGDTPKGMAVCGDFVYVSLAGGAVKCYDVSTPTAPSPTATVTISDFTPYQKMLQMGFNHIYALGVQTSTGKPTLAVLKA